MKGTAPSPASFGDRVRQLRQAAGLSQSQLAQRSSMAPSSVSKIETGQMSPTYDLLLRLSAGLGIDLADLLTGGARPPPSPPGPAPALARLTVSRRDDLVPQDAGVYTYLPLATGIRRKVMDPTLVRLAADDIRAFGALIRHPGEEFVYVIEGSVELHTDHYEPVRLGAGDSCYYDAAMGHGFIRAGGAPAVILNITAHPTVAPDRTGSADDA